MGSVQEIGFNKDLEKTQLVSGVLTPIAADIKMGDRQSGKNDSNMISVINGNSSNIKLTTRSSRHNSRLREPSPGMAMSV